jgi:hypothetical protein
MTLLTGLLLQRTLVLTCSRYAGIGHEGVAGVLRASRAA